MSLERWTPGPIWTGSTVICLASGPSLNKGQLELSEAHVSNGGIVIVINTTWESAPWATLLWGCDKRWWDWPSGQRALGEFNGIKATQDARAATAYGLKWLECRCDPDVADQDQMISHGGFDPEPGFMRSGRNGGYQVIHLAAQLGASVIALVGYDMQPGPDGRVHAHEEHPKPTRPDVFEKVMLPVFPTITPPLRALGVRVVNCTPGSALKCFEFDDLENVL